MIERNDLETGVEWLQRSIFSREQRALVDGLPSNYITISNVLVDSVKEQFNSLKELSTMVCLFVINYCEKFLLSILKFRV